METLVRDTDHLRESVDLDYLKCYDDVVTQFSELVDGSMRTTFELTNDGTDLYGRDCRSMDEITNEAVKEARILTAINPEMGFELRRRNIEREEYELLREMANGKGPNTMIVISDFPEELMASTEDVGGYNVTRKQSMLRVMTRQKHGNIIMISQSLDGSNRNALNSIYQQFDQEPQDGELLGQRISIDIASTEQEKLVDQITHVYDQSLADQFGGEWHAGRRPADYRNTYDFVCSQQDIVSSCIDLQLAGTIDNQHMYNLAAAMQNRFKISADVTSPKLDKYYTNNPYPISIEVLQREINIAGAEARQGGISFSACGVTLGPGGLEISTADQLANSGFGNKAGEDKYGSLQFKCPKKGCLNTRKPGKLIEKCQKCDADVRC